MTSTEATVDSTKLDTSSSRRNESGTGKAKEEKDERHRGWIYVVCCLLCLVVVLLTLCYLGWAMLWCPTFKRDATTSQSTIGTTTTISESTEDDHVSTALTSPKDDDHKTSEVTDETTTEKSTAVTDETTTEKGTDEPQEKTTTERITPEPSVPPIETNFSRFRNANLSCVIGTRRDDYRITTADLLELCLKIVAPVLLDYNGHLGASLRDDIGLRQKYGSRFYWVHESDVVDRWKRDKEIFMKTKMQDVLPNAAGYGLSGFHVTSGVTTGFLKAFIQSLGGMPSTKIILVVFAEDVEQSALENLEPSAYKGVGEIVLARIDFGNCARRGIWHEEKFLKKAHLLQKLPSKVVLSTTIGPTSLAHFNTSGHGECSGGAVAVDAFEECRYQDRAVSDRFECEGNWYGAETKESVADFADYIKMHGFSGCALQDLEILKSVASIIDRNFTAFTCR